MSDPSQPAPQDRSGGEITVLLERMHAGDGAALERLLPLVYDELRATARRALRREQTGHTLHATELVHEAFFKLVGSADGVRWQGRAHFLAVASRAMRQVLVEHARRRLAEKRGGGAAHVTLGDAPAEHVADDGELLALNDALDRLEASQPRLRALVEHRYFGGLSEREIAEVLGVSERTVQRDWARARAWLHKELYQRTGPA
jgi:RNA polymerase sigma factor (TIGR02999 family)